MLVVTGQVAFVPDTHYAFTVGKDGLVKYWDADRWELLLTLEGHKAEVCSLVPPKLCCLAADMSPRGDTSAYKAQRCLRLCSAVSSLPCLVLRASCIVETIVAPMAL